MTPGLVRFLPLAHRMVAGLLLALAIASPAAAHGGRGLIVDPSVAAPGSTISVHGSYLWTDQPVTIEDSRGIIRGQGLEFDNKAKTLKLNSRVSGTFQPQDVPK